MANYELTEIKQNGKVSFYAAVIPVKTIVRLAKKEQERDYQRPLMEKKVREIYKYLKGEKKNDFRILPGSIIINVTKNELVKEEAGGDGKRKLYLSLPDPDNKEDFEKYRGCVEILDGQHRVMAFNEEYTIDGGLDDDYELNFSVFINLDRKEKTKIFLSANKKQDKIPENLIRTFEYNLGLIEGDDLIIYEIVKQLKESGSSPLKDRILFGSEKKKYGLKEAQISKILGKLKDDEKKKNKVNHKIWSHDDSEKTAKKIAGTMAEKISAYLAAWEECYDFKFSDAGGTTAAVKMCGLRYMLRMMDTIDEVLRLKYAANATKENYAEIIKEIKTKLDLSRIFEAELTEFNSEGATVKLANRHSELVDQHIISKISKTK